MVRSLVLFGHVVGVLALCSGLIFEWVGWRTVRRSSTRPEALASIRVILALPRVYGIALATIVASGGYLGGRLGMLRGGWMLASYGGLLLIALSAAVARPRVRALREALNDPSDHPFSALRSAANDLVLHVSLDLRIALALAIVYLMIGRPDAGAAAAIIGLAFASALVTSLSRSRAASVPIRSSVQ